MSEVDEAPKSAEGWDGVSKKAADWDGVSKKAEGWDAVSTLIEAPAANGNDPVKGRFTRFSKPPLSPEEAAAQKLAAEQAAAKREEERKLEEARAEEKRIEDKKLADKKLAQDRLEKRRAKRLASVHRGFLMKEFTLSAKRTLKAAIPVSLLLLLGGATIMGLVIMWKVMASDCSNPFGGGPGPGAPPITQPEDGKKPPVKIPDGDGTPDNPDPAKWGWDKYFDKDKKKITP